MSSLREFAIGCTGHFLIGLAAAILIGGTAHIFGFSGRFVFAVVVIVVFLVSALFPSKNKGER